MKVSPARNDSGGLNFIIHNTQDIAIAMKLNSCRV